MAGSDVSKIDTTLAPGHTQKRRKNGGDTGSRRGYFKN